MSWAFKTEVPLGSSFNGELAYPSTYWEVSDTIYQYLNSVDRIPMPQYILKYTGLESTTHKIRDRSEGVFRIMFTGDLQHWLQEQLHRLAIAMNGAGATLQFKCPVFDGTFESPVTYKCRWVDAGDFVENSSLLCGGSMDLMYFLPAPADNLLSSVNDVAGITEYADMRKSNIDLAVYETVGISEVANMVKSIIDLNASEDVTVSDVVTVHVERNAVAVDTVGVAEYVNVGVS